MLDFPSPITTENDGKSHVANHPINAAKHHFFISQILNEKETENEKIQKSEMRVDVFLAAGS